MELRQCEAQDVTNYTLIRLQFIWSEKEGKIIAFELSLSLHVAVFKMTLKSITDWIKVIDSAPPNPFMEEVHTMSLKSHFHLFNFSSIIFSTKFCFVPFLSRFHTPHKEEFGWITNKNKEEKLNNWKCFFFIFGG